MNQVLFLCTGNYYRSRTAEELFNYYAQRRRLDWRASSKGLREDMESSSNVGPMAAVAIRYLEDLRVPVQARERMPESVRQIDFINSDRVICLDETEHRPMMQLRFDAYMDKVEYWSFPDRPLAEPEVVLPAIHRRVQLMVEALSER